MCVDAFNKLVCRTVSRLLCINAFNPLVLGIKRCHQMNVCWHGFPEMFNGIMSSLYIVCGHSLSLMVM